MTVMTFSLGQDIIFAISFARELLLIFHLKTHYFNQKLVRLKIAESLPSGSNPCQLARSAGTRRQSVHTVSVGYFCW